MDRQGGCPRSGEGRGGSILILLGGADLPLCARPPGYLSFGLDFCSLPGFPWPRSGSQDHVHSCYPSCGLVSAATFLASTGAVLGLLVGFQGCDPHFCLVWFRFRLFRRYLS